MERSAVIAIGGNALILDGQKGSIAEQFANATETASHIAALVADGWRVVVTHGNWIPRCVYFSLVPVTRCDPGHAYATFFSLNSSEWPMSNGVESAFPLVDPDQRA